jgi:hypothetical protein
MELVETNMEERILAELKEDLPKLSTITHGEIKKRLGDFSKEELLEIYFKENEFLLEMRKIELEHLRDINQSNNEVRKELLLGGGLLTQI